MALEKCCLKGILSTKTVFVCVMLDTRLYGQKHNISIKLCVHVLQAVL